MIKKIINNTLEAKPKEEREKLEKEREAHIAKRKEEHARAKQCATGWQYNSKC